MPRVAQNRRAFALRDFKMLDDTPGSFTGYLAVFGNEDLGGDIIEPGAFTKTLADARERKARDGDTYLFPILYQHDDKAPCGGFLDAHEDPHGLYVKGQLDLDTQLGRETYSGLKKGYMRGLSIGYSTIKHKWVGDVRHLQQLQLFEGSVVTFAMNPEAMVGAVKGASGASDWPLGDRDAAWDGGAAHKRIVAWATDDAGDVDAAKLKSVHFYSPDGDAAENVSQYKLLFCDVVDGDIKAMPKGIEACAGSHGVDNTTGISDGDKATIRTKITGYYHKMAKAFDDDSIVAPWDAKALPGAPESQSPDAPRRKTRDFNTAFQALAQSDQLQDEWGDTWQAIVTALADVMYQAYAQVNYPYAGMETIDPVEAAQSNLDAFTAAVVDLVKRSVAANFVPCLDDDGDSFLDPDGPNAGDDSGNGYMSANDLVADVRAFRNGRGDDVKDGRTVSAANHGMMMKALGMIGDGHKMLTEFAKANDPANPGNEPPQQSDSIYDPGFGKGATHAAPRTSPYTPRAGARPAPRRPQATTDSNSKSAGATDGRGSPQATTHDGATDPSDDVARFHDLMATMRREMHKEPAPVAG